MGKSTNQKIAIGPIHADIDENGIRSVCWHGVEVLRGLSAPIRDSDWGTMIETLEGDELKTTSTSVNHVRRFKLRDAKGCGVLSTLFYADGRVLFDWSFEAGERMSVNRAGICLLHPLAGVAGEEMSVTRPDGTKYIGSFPTLIAPAQPARDISGLAHRISGVDVVFNFEGETFEMEDQRNWSDASFKTYCRPLSAPSPFVIDAGTTLHQRVEMSLGGTPDKGEQGGGVSARAKMPEILLAVEPDWIGAAPNGCALLARFASKNWSDSDIESLAQTPWDAEFVVPEGQDPKGWLTLWSERFAKAGTTPRHVIALPEAYLNSYQPEGPWPKGATPEVCALAASEVFPSARIGVGMLTNFTEFNRCPPRSDLGDYITHGNAAIVHAADDQSVLQTLETLPAIFRSARTLGGARPYRLGLVAIGMRGNPYGGALIANTDGEKCTMTDCDPRQDTDFAATYAVVAAGLAALDGAEAICLAAPNGPFAMGGPLEHALGALASLAGSEVTVSRDNEFFSISGATGTIEANATLTEQNELPPTSWRFISREERI